MLVYVVHNSSRYYLLKWCCSCYIAMSSLSLPLTPPNPSTSIFNRPTCSREYLLVIVLLIWNVNLVLVSFFPEFFRWNKIWNISKLSCLECKIVYFRVEISRISSNYFLTKEFSSSVNVSIEIYICRRLQRSELWRSLFGKSNFLDPLLPGKIKFKYLVDETRNNH